MNEYVFLNDRLVNSDQAQISIYDAGLLHGIGLFETMRSYRGKVFRLEDHLSRLFNSAETLGIKISQDRSAITAAIYTLLEANNFQDGRLRLTLTRGSIKEVSDDNPSPSVLFITAAAMQPYPQEFYRKGMTVTFCDYKQNPDDPTTSHKTLNFFARLLALQQAQAKHAGESLWFTPTNRLAEGCISNVFLVSDNTLVTPPLDTAILPGITRRVVLELARDNDIDLREGPLVINDVMKASEVFLTNSIMELMPVCRVERHAVGTEKPGPIYKKLHELYRESVEAQCP